MTSIFAPPPGFSATKLGAYAALGFVMAAVALVPTFNRDAGIPDRSILKEAHGRVMRVNPHKYGVKFQLYGRTETFDYPSKARAYRVVESALATAGNKEVAILFNPNPRMPWFSSDAYYDVWQLDINGKSVRTAAEIREGWRSDNAIAPWLFVLFLLSSLYLSLLARRARVQMRV